MERIEPESRSPSPMTRLRRWPKYYDLTKSGLNNNMGTPTQYNPPWLWPAKENTRQHSYTGWVPFPGTKRKADDANSHEADYRPSSKQFLMDEEAASVADGKKGRRMFATPTEADKLPWTPSPQSSEEMEVVNEEIPLYQNGPGDINHTFDEGMKRQKLDEKECCTDITHSMHESQPHASSSDNSRSMNGVSLILSAEIQETLAQKKLNVGCILPRPIMDLRVQSNAMALVPWKPRGMSSLLQPQVQRPPSRVNPRIAKSTSMQKSLVSQTSNQVNLCKQNNPMISKPLQLHLSRDPMEVQNQLKGDLSKMEIDDSI